MHKMRTNDDWQKLSSGHRVKRLSTPMSAISNNLTNGAEQPREAAVIVVKNGDRILFLQRRDTLLYTLPGGGTESGESPFQSAVRELKEETNIDADELSYVGNGLAKDGTLVHAFTCDFRLSRTELSEITFINDPDHEALSFVWARPGTDIWKHVMSHAQHPDNIPLKLLGLQ